jgi:aminopeptidase-like protein
MSVSRHAAGARVRPIPSIPACGLSHLADSIDLASEGRKMLELIGELFPICRSITGEGLRQSLDRVGALIPLQTHEVPTGTQAFDWTVPKEWNIRDAYIKSPDGRRVVDFRENSLHVVNYSAPVNARLSLRELRPHLHSLPDRPDWIPYRTTYYAETWGFCLSHRRLESLSDAEYDVVIDASLSDGALTYGECVLPGEVEEEFLISAHICHPSLANDNLSGVAVAAALAQILERHPHRFTYRFLFAPGTIGPIAWLARNQDKASRIRHGLVLACVGDRGCINYKRSRRGNADVDRAVECVLRGRGEPFEIREFAPYGYDERQFCSPGFNLPVGSFRRTPHGEYPEYHTSADDLGFVSAPHLADTLGALLEVIDLLESDARYLNLSPMGEPQLGKRGLLPAASESEMMALLWMLNLSDGGHRLLDITERAGLPFDALRRATENLLAHGLLDECREPEKSRCGERLSSPSVAPPRGDRSF